MAGSFACWGVPFVLWEEENQGSLQFLPTSAVLNFTQFSPEAESLPPFWFVSSLLRFGIGKTIAGKTRT